MSMLYADLVNPNPPETVNTGRTDVLDLFGTCCAHPTGILCVYASPFVWPVFFALLLYGYQHAKRTKGGDR